MTSSIADYLRTQLPPRATAASPAGAGITVLIPTYTPADADRTATLRLCVDSALAAARYAGDAPIAFVVIDNGLSGAAARSTGELLRAAHRPYRIISAAGADQRRYTAGNARNAGLAFLGELPADSPLRRRHLLFLDDDTAVAPDALARLGRVLDDRPGAIAACPRVVPVADLASWPGRAGPAAPRPGAPRPGDEPGRLPGPLSEAGYDLLSVTSHGSLVTGRTVGLLVRAEPVLGLVRAHGRLFFEGTPYGSSEDILVMALLSRLGELWRVPAAAVADEARKTPGGTFAQQFAWGYDHAWLARTLGEAGLLDSGVHVLSWRQRAGWEQSRLNWSQCTGFVINPAELRLGLRLLAALTADPVVRADMFGAMAEPVAAGTRLLGTVLGKVLSQVGGAACRAAGGRARPDLPALRGRDWSSLRGGLDALVGHLAGNVVGSLDNTRHDDIAVPGGLPAYFLYGARQAAAPESPSTTTSTPTG
jgi:hypothetical protein